MFPGFTDLRWDRSIARDSPVRTREMMRVRDTMRRSSSGWRHRMVTEQFMQTIGNKLSKEI